MSRSGYAAQDLEREDYAHIWAGVRRSVYVETLNMIGTGTIIQTGLVLTNWHVLEDNSNVVVNKHPARLIHFDIARDLAALATRTRRVQPVQFLMKVRKYMPVFYVGNPQNWTQAVTPGSVIWHSKTKIVSTALPGDGCSGSGLYDLKTGRMVGMMDSRDGPNNSEYFGIAVPAGIIYDFWLTALWKLNRLDELRKQEQRRRGERKEEQTILPWG